MKVTVLVADDDEIINDLEGLLLQQAGFQVLSTFSGREAVEIANRDKPEVLILDIGLPDIDGIEVIEKLKNSCPETKIIVTTGARDNDILEQLLKLGVAKYLKKPFQIQELIEEVNRLLKES